MCCKCTITCTSSRLGYRASAAVRPRLSNSLPTHDMSLVIYLLTCVSFCMVCPLHWSGVFSLCRMPLHGSYSVYTAFRAHLSCAHQPSLAAHPWAHLLQTGSFNIPSHSWRWTELSPVLLHSQTCRHVDLQSAVAVSGAVVWNNLPAHVTAAPSLAVFRQRLKNFLFLRSYPDIVI